MCVCVCVDFCQLNNKNDKGFLRLIKHRGAIGESSGSNILLVTQYEVWILTSGIEEALKESTVLSVDPLGFYEFNRLPFRIYNSPATYQRFMEECLGYMHLKICLICLDDLVIFVNSYEGYLHRLKLTEVT